MPTSPRSATCSPATPKGRRSDDETTAFDSTGLALQDLAVALIALERADELDLPRVDL